MAEPHSAFTPWKVETKSVEPKKTERYTHWVLSSLERTFTSHLSLKVSEQINLVNVCTQNFDRIAQQCGRQLCLHFWQLAWNTPWCSASRGWSQCQTSCLGKQKDPHLYTPRTENRTGEISWKGGHHLCGRQIVIQRKQQQKNNKDPGSALSHLS